MTLILDVDAALAPVADGAPAGRNIRYEPVLDKLKAARKVAEADTTTPAAWRAVGDLAQEILRTHSKDLQVALWLVESATRLDGFRGATTGLVLLRRLLEEYWDALFPETDPDDSEPLGFRAGLMQWVDERLPLLLRAVPLSDSPAAYTLLHYEATQTTGDQKKALIEDGWPTSEQFEEAMGQSSLAQLERTIEEIAECQEALAALERVTDARFVERRTMPSGSERTDTLLSFARLRETLETATWLLERTARPKRSTGAVEIGGGASGVTEPVRSGSGTAALDADLSPDAEWTQAYELVRSNQLDGLRILQARIAQASSGRDRFLRQLQFAEVCLEAGIHALAYPIFDDIAKTIEARELEAWEHRDVMIRAWRGLARCCELLSELTPELETRRQEALERIDRVGEAVFASRTGSDDGS